VSSTVTAPRPWLFSPVVDLSLFVGTAALALALVPLGPLLGVDAQGAAPEWTWVTGVLMVDVAHVWATSFVVYLEPRELRRHPLLYVGTPIVAAILGMAVYALGEAVFWRLLAYLAIFHFVRQQWGFVAMYGRRMGETARLGRVLDALMIHAAAGYPLLVWHTRLPRAFAWMREGDLVTGLPAWVVAPASVAYALIAAAYVGNAIVQSRVAPVNWGKHTVVAATAACWYVGILGTNSDYAFTVTNVFIHGVPYLALVFLYARAGARSSERPRGIGARTVAFGVLPFLLTLWAVAYAEELLWDRMIWHDRAWLFGAGGDIGSLRALVVPLLAVPQLTHYVLDGFVWRRSHNPELSWRLP